MSIYSERSDIPKSWNPLLTVNISSVSVWANKVKNSLTSGSIDFPVCYGPKLSKVFNNLNSRFGAVPKWDLKWILFIIGRVSPINKNCSKFVEYRVAPRKGTTKVRISCQYPKVFLPFQDVKISTVFNQSKLVVFVRFQDPTVIRFYDLPNCHPIETRVDLKKNITRLESAENKILVTDTNLYRSQ